MSKRKLEILNEIFKMITDYIIDNKVEFVSLNKKVYMSLNNTFKIIELDNSLDFGNNCYYGKTMVKVDKWISYSQGVKIADPNNYNVEYIAVKFKENDKDLPLELVIYTFIHELAHALTIPEKHQIKNLSNSAKKKLDKLQPMQNNDKKSIPLHHNRSFYLNLIILLRIAEKLNIYILPKEFNSFVYSKIIRYDCMINPEDNMSKGKIPLF